MAGAQSFRIFTDNQKSSTVQLAGSPAKKTLLASPHSVVFVCLFPDDHAVPLETHQKTIELMESKDGNPLQ